ncbi:hypothetical protein [Winogradskyella sp.]|uniref:hypothetical protein n=1 Tax=Winogradskyella sp. TaxID=1883156 RepID=UPI002604ACDE|nr:hypothetical protein [Winogradskyella sp.]
MKTLKLFIPIVIFLFISIFSCSSDDQENLNSDNNNNASNAIPLECDINEDVTLMNHSEGIDYVIDCNLEINAIVTIEPGTTFIFKSDGSMYVNDDGALSAIGTDTNPIIFQGEEPVAGFWRGIGFESNDVRNELNHVIVTDAGSSPINSTWVNQKVAVVIYKTTTTGKLTIKNTTIENTDGIGLLVMNNITGTSIADLRNFENNTFNNNIGQAVRLSAKHVQKIDANSTYTNNGFDGISIRESKLNDNTNHVWQGLNYKIDGEIEVEKGLSILPGAHLEFTPNGFMSIDGDNAYLNAEGSIFTGEVNIPGSWKGLYYFDTNNTQNRLSNCEISYGGSDSHNFVSNRANITIFHGSRLTVNNCTISNSGGCGIVVGTSNSGWDQCIFNGNSNSYNSIASNNICDEG